MSSLFQDAARKLEEAVLDGSPAEFRPEEQEALWHGLSGMRGRLDRITSLAQAEGGEFAHRVYHEAQA